MTVETIDLYRLTFHADRQTIYTNWHTSRVAAWQELTATMAAVGGPWLGQADLNMECEQVTLKGTAAP